RIAVINSVRRQRQRGGGNTQNQSSTGSGQMMMMMMRTRRQRIPPCNLIADARELYDNMMMMTTTTMSTMPWFYVGHAVDFAKYYYGQLIQVSCALDQCGREILMSQSVTRNDDLASSSYQRYMTFARSETGLEIRAKVAFLEELLRWLIHGTAGRS